MYHDVIEPTPQQTATFAGMLVPLFLGGAVLLYLLEEARRRPAPQRLRRR